MTASETRGVRLPRHQWDLLRRLAETNGRSLSWAVSAVVRVQLERRPGVPDEPESDKQEEG
jgi:hypothetical protein